MEDSAVSDLKRRGEKSWPAIWVGIYMFALLLLLVFEWSPKLIQKDLAFSRFLP